jgi:peptidoglycan/LPS O-acetylase OafA/YrhL
MTPKSAADPLAPAMALSHVLNFSRALAALLVLFFHVRSTLVVPYDHLANWSRRSDDLSFSLYVTHYPLIMLYIHFLEATHRHTRHATITPLVLLEFVCLCLACIAVASGFSALFERPRSVFKKLLTKRLPTSLSAKPDNTAAR